MTCIRKNGGYSYLSIDAKKIYGKRDQRILFKIQRNL